MSPEKIVWIDGYPRVVGVNAPPEEPEALPEKILTDAEWEAQAKEMGITGWDLTRAFIRRVLGGE